MKAYTYPFPLYVIQMWPDLIAKSKEGGADVVQTYVFWNKHEPVRGQVESSYHLNYLGKKTCWINF